MRRAGGLFRIDTSRLSVGEVTDRLKNGWPVGATKLIRRVRPVRAAKLIRRARRVGAAKLIRRARPVRAAEHIRRARPVRAAKLIRRARPVRAAKLISHSLSRVRLVRLTCHPDLPRLHGSIQCGTVAWRWPPQFFPYLG
jgi:hypothetical protein